MLTILNRLGSKEDLSSLNSMSNILSSLTIRSGVRQINHNATGRERQAIPLAHGYRKFYTTQLINAKVNPEVREMLLNHSIGLASSYYRPTEDEMLEEYMKGVDLLTVEPTQRMARKIQTLEIERSQIDVLTLELAEIKKAMN